MFKVLRFRPAKIYLTIIFVILLFFTRFYNLDGSAIFFWDETIDLIKIHQYYLEKKITLVGPISEDGSKVYGSLTYYMLMPFAVLGKFDPVSTAIGAAFWGSMSAILIIYLVKIINRKIVLLMGLLVLIWFPLIETSRWSWNPNFAPFWIVLGLILFQCKNIKSLFLSGFTLGLSIHHHYIAAFAVGTFILIVTIQAIEKGEFRKYIFIPVGLLAAIVPFMIFDLRHPPGLFLSRVLYFNQISFEQSSTEFLIRLWTNYKAVLFYYTHSTILIIIVMLLSLFLLFNDVKQKSRALIYFFPWFSQITTINFIANSFIHYFLPGLIFFIAWIIYPREEVKNLTARLVIIVLIIGSLGTFIPQITSNPWYPENWQPNIKTVRLITNAIEQSIKTENLKNVNIVVLGSQDNNTYGLKYRNLLLLKEINLMSRNEYFTNDHLFVISQSNEEKVRNDAAAEMFNFKSGNLKGEWQIVDSNWKVYLFDKNTQTKKTI